MLSKDEVDQLLNRNVKYQKPKIYLPDYKYRTQDVIDYVSSIYKDSPDLYVQEFEVVKPRVKWYKQDNKYIIELCNSMRKPWSHAILEITEATNCLNIDEYMTTFNDDFYYKPNEVVGAISKYGTLLDFKHRKGKSGKIVNEILNYLYLGNHKFKTFTLDELVNQGFSKDFLESLIFGVLNKDKSINLSKHSKVYEWFAGNKTISVGHSGFTDSGVTLKTTFNTLANIMYNQFCPSEYYYNKKYNLNIAFKDKDSLNCKLDNLEFLPIDEKKPKNENNSLSKSQIKHSKDSASIIARLPSSIPCAIINKYFVTLCYSLSDACKHLGVSSLKFNNLDYCIMDNAVITKELTEYEKTVLKENLTK